MNNSGVTEGEIICPKSERVGSQEDLEFRYVCSDPLGQIATSQDPGMLTAGAY